MNYIALIWNNNDVYDRHYIRSTYDEDKETFIKRVHNCYKNSNYNIEIYILGEYID